MDGAATSTVAASVLPTAAATGMQRYYNDGLRNNTTPALTWYGTVTAVRNETGPKGKPRKVATVDVTPGRWVSVQLIIKHDVWRAAFGPSRHS